MILGIIIILLVALFCLLPIILCLYFAYKSPQIKFKSKEEEEEYSDDLTINCII